MARGNNKHPLELFAHELMAAFASGGLSPDEHFENQLAFAKYIDEYLHAFYELAESLSEKRDRGESECTDVGFAGQIPVNSMRPGGALSYSPVSFKDVFAVKNFKATAGSRILENYRPPFDSTIVARVREAGNYVAGKTSLDEFAMGSSNETSAYGPCFNPFDLGRVPGGSSGGGAVSVAACQAAAGWGTDTGGSVRQPAALCGVVGFKPTYGLLSRFGIIAYASSLDTPSIFSRCALDAALMMNGVCFPDEYDSTCRVPSPLPDFVDESEPDRIRKPKLAIIKELSGKNFLHPGVAERFYAAVDALARDGAEIEEVSFPLWNITLPAYYIITTAECSSNLARYDGVRFGPAGGDGGGLMDMYLARRGGEHGFGAETKRRILLGTYVLSAGYFDAYYNKARAIRRAIQTEVAALTEKYDALILPTSPEPAFKLGERLDDPVKMYMSDIATVIANLAGACAISLPCGTCDSDGGSNGPENGELSDAARAAGVKEEWLADCRGADGKIKLPVGFQMVCGRYADTKLLSLARRFEEATGLEYETPPFVAKRLAEFGGAR